MTIGLLIIAHDKIGTAIKNTAISLVGSCPLPIESLELCGDCDTEESLETAQNLVNTLNQGDGVLILTDLFGSTPYNITAKLSSNENVIIISGLNLPMLIRALNYPSLPLSEIAEKVLDGGRNGILICN
ncbi:MAG: PTS fructose transporter subunit IIA [Gammaproteobacteria bacterium]|nr:PTS fructose transporter subunit IIA [Gammaproteobacteria bacterium]